jgi:hypothetical protein
MLAVAAVAIVVGAFDMKRRRDAYLERAADHAWKEWSTLEGVRRMVRDLAFAREEHRRVREGGRDVVVLVDEWVDAIISRRDQVDWLRRRARYEGELRRKYEYAARFLWLHVAPDPPRPE